MTSPTLAGRISIFTVACALAVSVGTFYERQAMAQTARPNVENGAARQSVELIAAAATVLSTAHYQAFLVLTCDSPSSSCSGDFPKVGGKRQLNVTGISCFITGTDSATFSFGDIQLIGSTGLFVLEEMLPLDFASVAQHYSINRTVDLQIAAAQHMKVFLQLEGGFPGQAFCTATGTMSTLQ